MFVAEKGKLFEKEKGTGKNDPGRKNKGIRKKPNMQNAGEKPCVCKVDRWLGRAIGF